MIVGPYKGYYAQCHFEFQTMGSPHQYRCKIAFINEDIEFVSPVQFKSTFDDEKSIDYLFKNAVDDYLRICNACSKKPAETQIGKIMTEISFTKDSLERKKSELEELEECLRKHTSMTETKSS